jgi:hypothetical protein
VVAVDVLDGGAATVVEVTGTNVDPPALDAAADGVSEVPPVAWPCVLHPASTSAATAPVVSSAARAAVRGIFISATPPDVPRLAG